MNSLAARGIGVLGGSLGPAEPLPGQIAFEAGIGGQASPTRVSAVILGPHAGLRVGHSTSGYVSHRSRSPPSGATSA